MATQQPLKNGYTNVIFSKKTLLPLSIVGSIIVILISVTIWIFSFKSDTNTRIELLQTTTNGNNKLLQFKLDQVQTDIVSLKKGVNKITEDHEKRIRCLEQKN